MALELKKRLKLSFKNDLEPRMLSDVFVFLLFI